MRIPHWILIGSLLCCQACAVMQTQQHEEQIPAQHLNVVRLTATVYKINDKKREAIGKVRLWLHEYQGIWVQCYTPWGLPIGRGVLMPNNTVAWRIGGRRSECKPLQQLSKKWPGLNSYAIVRALILGEKPPRTMKHKQDWKWTIDSEADAIKHLTIITQDQHKLAITYSNFRAWARGDLWSKANVIIKQKNTAGLALEIQLGHSSAETLPVPVAPPFSITSP